MKQDAKEVSRTISKMFVVGNVLFPQLTAEQNAKAKFPSDKPTMSVVFPKGEGDHDTISGEINALHALVGGSSDIVRDGDSDDLKQYNSGCWVMRVRFGPRAKVVDTAKKSIPLEYLEMGDTVRVGVSLYDYSDRNKKGVSIYVNWLMLVAKGGLDAIPDFEGDGFIASDAAPTNGVIHDIPDAPAEDPGEEMSDARLPQSMMDMLAKQRAKSATTR